MDRGWGAGYHEGVFQGESTTRQDVQEFWRRTEEELGETVEAYAMAHCISGCLESGAGLWGLAFITNRALYFHHFAKQNWFMSIVTAERSAASKEVKLDVDRESIREVSISREPSLLKRIFAYSPPTLDVTYLDPAGREQIMRLALDTKLKEFEGLLAGE
ncbi:MAG: hypothetical protein ACLFO1_09610 [Spirochaetaceae bacterium]